VLLLGLLGAAAVTLAAFFGAGAAFYDGVAASSDDDIDVGPAQQAADAFRASCTAFSEDAGGGCDFACSYRAVGGAGSCDWCTTPPPGTHIQVVCVGSQGNASLSPAAADSAAACAAPGRGRSCSSCQYNSTGGAAGACAVAAASLTFAYALRRAFGCCPAPAPTCQRSCASCCCACCGAASCCLGGWGLALLTLATLVARGSVCREGCRCCCVQCVGGVGGGGGEGDSEELLGGREDNGGVGADVVRAPHIGRPDALGAPGDFGSQPDAPGAPGGFGAALLAIPDVLSGQDGFGGAGGGGGAAPGSDAAVAAEPSGSEVPEAADDPAAAETTTN